DRVDAHAPTGDTVEPALLEDVAALLVHAAIGGWGDNRARPRDRDEVSTDSDERRPATRGAGRLEKLVEGGHRVLLASHDGVGGVVRVPIFGPYREGATTGLGLWASQDA